jgi:hypothetical protein
LATLRDSSGKPVAGAVVNVRHEPTGTVYSAVTNATGRYSFSGVVVGGPFTVTASSGDLSVNKTDIETQLGATIDVNLTVAAARAPDVDKLEAFRVVGDTNDLDSGAAGAGRPRFTHF